MLLSCPGCRRFLRAETSSCPFCGQAIAEDRSPIGGFLGVLLGVCLTACGGDGDDTGTGGGSMTASSTNATEESSGSGGSSTTMGESSAEVTGPLYGPVSESTGVEGSSEGTTGESSSDDSSGSSDSTDSSGSGDSTDSTGNVSDSVGPLYGPATGG